VKWKLEIEMELLGIMELELKEKIFFRMEITLTTTADVCCVTFRTKVLSTAIITILRAMQKHFTSSKLGLCAFPPKLNDFTARFLGSCLAFKHRMLT